MNFVMSYSGGKDSALALHELMRQGHVPLALVVTVNPEQQRSWFHGIQQELLNAVSDSMGIPLIACPCGPDDYTGAFEAGLMEAKRRGALACAFGDIDEEGHRQWDEERCAAAGLDCLLPLWQQNREELTYRNIQSGIRAMIKIVQLSALDTSYLGRTLTMELAEQIRAAGADMCGENGEYHTFVYDGPMFHHPVKVHCNEIVDLGTHAAADLCLEQRIEYALSSEM